MGEEREVMHLSEMEVDYVMVKPNLLGNGKEWKLAFMLNSDEMWESHTLNI